MARGEQDAGEEQGGKSRRMSDTARASADPGLPGRSVARLIPLVVASALFMDLMDTAAIATALPTMARELHVAPVDLKFALTAYMLTIAVLVPASGWFAGRFGVKRVFMVAMAVFTLGSACCALSDSLAQLVASRILQGIGGSMMTPVGRSIVVAVMPRAELVKAMALFTVPAIIAPLIGPPLAGLMLEYGSWRWIFLINLPIGLAGLLAVLLYVPRLPSLHAGGFDARGFLLMCVAVLAVMVLAETGGLAGQPAALRITALAAAPLAFYLYSRHALTAKAPIIDLKLLRLDTLRVSLLSSMVQRMPVGATPFLLPLLLQAGMGMSPLAASQVMIAMAGGGLLARFAAPPALRRLGFRDTMLVFGALTAAGVALPIGFGIGTSIAAMMVAMAFTSFVRSIFFIPAMTLAYADVPERSVGHATVLFTVAQQVSLSLGISLAAWLLDLAATPGAALTPADFAWPFAVMAVIGALSLPAVWPLRTDAGDALRGRRVDLAD